MKINLIITLLLGSWMSMTSQEVTFYKTYEDYNNNQGEKYGKFIGYHAGSGTFKQDSWVHFKRLDKPKKKIVFTCSVMWGLKYDGKLFRVYHYNDGMTKYYYLAQVMWTGEKSIYYINGDYALESISTPKDEMKTSFSGSSAYLSKDLKSEMFAFQCFPYTDSHKKRMGNFTKKHPSLMDLMEKFEKDPCYTAFDYSIVLQEMKKFDAIKK